MDKQAEKFMEKAYKLALRARDMGEVPVGCVIVKDGKVIASAHNLRQSRQDATAHAEVLAIQKACKKTRSFRLTDCQLYVTLEPCAMCAGAIVNARLQKVYFGAYDAKAGCCGTLYSLIEDGRFNHSCPVQGGVLKEQCAAVLSDFFAGKRKKIQTDDGSGTKTIDE